MLLRLYRSGAGLTPPTLLLLGRLVGFWRLSEAEQLSAQLVALPFGRFASPALPCHPLAQRALRHLAAGPLGAKLALGLSRGAVGLRALRRLLYGLGGF